MTLTADRGAAPDHDWSDRRAHALGPRLSWASPRPFDVRHTPFNEPEIRSRGWAVAGLRYRRSVVTSDLLLAGVVGATILVPRLGASVGTALWVLLAAVGFVASVALLHGYHMHRIGTGVQEFQSVALGGMLLSAAVIMSAFTLQASPPRSVVFIGVPALVLAASIARYVLRKRLHHQRRLGLDMQRTVVIGSPVSAVRAATDLQAAPHEGYDVVGMCLPSIEDEADADTVPVLGAIADVVQVVADYAIDVVIVTGGVLSGDATRRLSWALDRAGAALVVVPELVEVSRPRLTVRPSGSVPMLEVEVAPPRRRLLAKAAMDWTITPVAAFVALPVVAVLALLVKLTSPGPAFYGATRAGVDGRPFTMWKLRSMYVDADARREELLARNEGSGVLFKLRDDPRVTPLGRIMRKFSLDELPQLWNVVRGDMSLVGPRPPLVSEVQAYEDQVHRRLRVKPGLTGLWQISGRSDLDWDDAVRLDLRYADNWSVGMDLQILWKTARAVLRPSGAY